MIGNFANYGEIFCIDGRYTVKERSDLFSPLPEGFSCDSILEVGCADSTNLRYFAKSLDTPIMSITFFLQDECSLLRCDFLDAYKRKLNHPNIGMVGESINFIFPPHFSSSFTSPMTMPRSTALHMS